MLLCLGLAVRAALLVFGSWQDAHAQVKFTDIDYEVITDAAAFMARGGSPFERSTYRYTPLLAAALVPNVTLHKSFGKLLFCAADMLAALDETLHTAHIELCFAEMKGPVKDKLKRFGLFARLGEDLFFPTIGAAVGGYLKTFPVEWVDWEDRGT